MENIILHSKLAKSVGKAKLKAIGIRHPCTVASFSISQGSDGDKKADESGWRGGGDKWFGSDKRSGWGGGGGKRSWRGGGDKWSGGGGR